MLMLIHTKCMDFFKELSVQKQIHWPLIAKLTEKKILVMFTAKFLWTTSLQLMVNKNPE